MSNVTDITDMSDHAWSQEQIAAYLAGGLSLRRGD